MKFKYVKETDSLFVILSDKKSVDSIEIVDGVIADLDESGNVIGIEFYSAKDKLNFDDLFLEELPFKNVNLKNTPTLVTA